MYIFISGLYMYSAYLANFILCTLSLMPYILEDMSVSLLYLIYITRFMQSKINLLCVFTMNLTQRLNE